MAETKTPLTEEQKMRRRAGRTIARVMFRADYQASSPEATKEELNAAWTEKGKAYTKTGMRAVRMLEKQGFALTFSGNLAEAGDD